MRVGWSGGGGERRVSSPTIYRTSTTRTTHHTREKWRRCIALLPLMRFCTNGASKSLIGLSAMETCNLRDGRSADKTGSIDIYDILGAIKKYLSTSIFCSVLCTPFLCQKKYNAVCVAILIAQYYYSYASSLFLTYHVSQGGGRESIRHIPTAFHTCNY